MSGIGGNNPTAFQLGGGPTSLDQIYNVLKQMVGIGGSAADETIEAEWRLARARALWASGAVDRALYQAWPNTATDFIEVWEDVLGVPINTQIPDQDRREVIEDLFVKVINAAFPGLEPQLQEIDPLFSIIYMDPEKSRTTVPGRPFQDHIPTDPDAVGPAFTLDGSRTFTSFPNYSDDFVVVVQYAIGSGAVTGEQHRRMNRAAAVLNETLPSWVDWRIIVDIGFTLDQSLLDVGAFGP